MKKQKLSENDIRDYLFSNHKDSMHELIIGRRNPIEWKNEGFPPIRILLQQIVENKINNIIDGFESLILSAKELRLEKSGDSTTRMDLFGNSEDIGITIIELKRSEQTERQAFTELLAYSNHLCSIFPGLTESAINSVLIAPMKTRIVRDAFVQEILRNNKSTAALRLIENNGKIQFEVYYPEESYYKWYENNLLDDRSMFIVAIEFPIINGWIDSDKNNNQIIPNHSKEALNAISSNISHRLEAEGLHALVYSSQKWGEISELFPNSNTIYTVIVNPFSSFRCASEMGILSGETNEGRLSEIQSLYDQIEVTEQKYLFEVMDNNFQGLAIRIVKESFAECFNSIGESQIHSEISLPDWHGVKISMIESVFTHNLDIYQTGLLRVIYLKYIEYIYEKSEDEIYYSDDLPKYSYKALRNFLPVWEILRGLGLGNDSSDSN